MREFLFKSAVIIVLFPLIGMVISTLVYSSGVDVFRDYEIPEMVRKLDFMRQNPDTYDTVFVGSSRIFRHLDPDAFDAATGHSTRSFNLGVQSFFPYRSFDVLQQDEILNPRVSNVLIELAPLGRIDQNYNKNPNIHSVNFERYLLVADLSFNHPGSRYSRLRYLIGYSALFLYKYAGFGIHKYVWIAAGFPSVPSELAGRPVGLESSGFFPLDKELQVRPSNSLRKRKEEFRNNADKVLSMYRESYAQMSIPDPPVTYAYLEWIRARLQQLRARGKFVVFVLPPRQTQRDLEDLHNQHRVLAEIPLIDFSDPDRYPALSTIENSFDRSHLNSAGARIMSAECGRQLRQILQSTRPPSGSDSP